MIQASIRYSVFAIRLFGIRYLVFEFADIHSIRYSSFFTIRRPLIISVSLIILYHYLQIGLLVCWMVNIYWILLCSLFGLSVLILLKGGGGAWVEFSLLALV